MARRKAAGASTKTAVSGVAGKNRGYGKARISGGQQTRLGSGRTPVRMAGRSKSARTTKVVR